MWWNMRDESKNNLYYTSSNPYLPYPKKRYIWRTCSYTIYRSDNKLLNKTVTMRASLYIFSFLSIWQSSLYSDYPLTITLRYVIEEVKEKDEITRQATDTVTRFLLFKKTQTTLKTCLPKNCLLYMYTWLTDRLPYNTDWCAPLGRSLHNK